MIKIPAKCAVLELTSFCLLLDDASRIRVAVRIRPFSVTELDSPHNYGVVECLGPCQLRCSRKGSPPLDYSVDHIFLSSENLSTKNENQENVYRTIGAPLLRKALAGFNTCLFAYGVTASGKTYSMYGPPECPGIVPRIVEDLFASITESKTSNGVTTVHLSYFEIYNEKLFDLLQDRKVTPKLSVREHPTKGPFVAGLIQPAVHSPAEVLAWLRQGDLRRSVAATGANAHSSRSHTIVTLAITRRELAQFTETETVENVYTSKLNLVDLAGSERQSITKNMNERLVESCQINKSLFTLGKVISQLSGDIPPGSVTMGCSCTDKRAKTPSAERHRPLSDCSSSGAFRTPQSTCTAARGKKRSFVSYRDSLLTWILKESLGGNSVTTMLATVSPSSMHFDETLATLQYAKRAQSIVNAAVVNEDPEGRIIRELRSEVDRLKQHLLEAGTSCSPLASEIQTLQNLLRAREREVAFLTSELTKRTLDCDLLRTAFSQNASPESSVAGGRFKRPGHHANSDGLLGDLADEIWDTPVLPPKRLKSVACSVEFEQPPLLLPTTPTHRLDPDGADDYELVGNASRRPSMEKRKKAELEEEEDYTRGSNLVHSEAQTEKPQDPSCADAAVNTVLLSSKLIESGVQTDVAPNRRTVSTFTQEIELGVTFMSVSLFNHLYEEIHHLRLRAPNPRESRGDFRVATADAASMTATNNMHILPKSEFDAMTERLESLREQLQRFKSIQRQDMATLTNAAMPVPEESKKQLIVECNCVKENSKLPAAKTPRVDDPVLAKFREACDTNKLLERQLKSKQWDIDYLEEVNQRLSAERNTLAKLLKSTLATQANHQTTRGVIVAPLPQLSECLQYMGQVSDEFRREMEVFIQQLGGAAADRSCLGGSRSGSGDNSNIKY